jgi:hypothetical protein
MKPINLDEVAVVETVTKWMSEEPGRYGHVIISNAEDNGKVSPMFCSVLFRWYKS